MEKDYSTFRKLDKTTQYYLVQISKIIENIREDELYSQTDLEEFQDNLGMLFQYLVFKPTGRLQELI